MRTLTDEELDQFRDQGFVVLPDVLSANRITLLRAAIARMIEEREIFISQHREEVNEMRAAEARGEIIHATEWVHVVTQMYQLWERLPAMGEHALDPGLAEMARAALNVPKLRLWFDQAMVKQPGDQATPFHQDNSYLPFDAESVITIWAPVTAVSEAMGCLRYVPGSHRWKRLPAIPLAGRDDLKSVLDDPDCLARAVGAEIPEGGVVMHHGSVIHGTNANTTDRPRPVVLTCYYPDGARRMGPLRQYAIERDCVAEGELVRGPGLPVVASIDEGSR